MLRLLSILLFVALPVAATAQQESAEALAAQGEFAAAAKQFAERADRLEDEGNAIDAVKALINAAACLKMSGDISLAGILIKRAERIRPADTPESLELRLRAEMGSIYALGKKPADAMPYLQRAARLATARRDIRLLADIYNDLGVAHSAQEQFEQAQLRFASAGKLARQLGDSDLAQRSRQNHLIASFQQWHTSRERVRRNFEIGDFRNGPVNSLTSARDAFTASLEASTAMVRQSTWSPLTVYHALTAGTAAHRFSQADPDRSEQSGRAIQLLGHARRQAEQLGDLQLERSAILALAEVYFENGKPDEALRLLDYARQLKLEDDPVQTSRLELLTAQCLRATGASAGRYVQALERSVQEMEGIRSDLARTQAISDLGRPFRERAGKPYLLLADHYLQQATANPAARQEMYQQARESIESFKAWELDDFFRDDCVNLALQERTRLDDIKDPSVAFLYIIPLEERTEILVGHKGESRAWSTPLPSRDLESLARRFRYHLEFDYGTFAYRTEAEVLYDNLIRPIREYLRDEGIKHLVFVPDGSLGTIPPAAFYDRERKRYLLQDYSISIAPNLSLTNLKPLKREKLQGLLFGISEAAGEFPPLPAVAREIEALSKLYPQRPPLLNRDFTAKAFQDAISGSRTRLVLHVASHGEFLGTAGESFLLAWPQTSPTKDDQTELQKKGYIDLDRLEASIRPKKYRGEPVELLCLSACRTAAGDDRAALGLAGAAVKSGSRSVLASLWNVEDDSAARTMINFHSNLLSDPSVSKVEALRKAQLELLEEDAHPRMWAPFTLIGNWK